MGSVLADTVDHVEGKNTLDITVEFTGGLEMLFSNERTHKIALPSRDSNGVAANISYLVKYLIENVMKDQRKELFVVDDAVRPGILVLINDADWELEGEDAYEIQKGDNILFVSTLHGG
ncbi:Ubiquitin- modifier 1 [Arthroderma sp. PD_2]|nr:Ubiquitin- modifier 1 [Arthroderma sp. PD_2]